MPRHLTAFTLLLAGAGLLASPARAQEARKLVYAPELAVGVVIESDIEIKSDQILTIAGMPLETHSMTFMKMHQTITDKTSEGGWKSEGTFKLVQSEMELPGGMQVSFNSNNPEEAKGDGPLKMIIDALKATADAKWVGETDDKHQFTKIEYVGDPFADVDPQVKGDSSPEKLKQAHRTELERYPSEPVSPGDTWKRTEESDLGGGQTITFEKEFTYVGPETKDGKTFDKVSIKTLTAEYDMDDDAPGQAKVTESELEVADSEGTYLYDREEGRFVDVREKVQMKGTLTLEVAGNKLPGELDLTIEANSKVKRVEP